jgi:hypothetical protein
MPDTNECFYVGYGLRNRPTYWKNTRNSAFREVIKVLASKGQVPFTSILEEGLSQEEAIEKEKERIRYRLSTGAPLTNNPKYHKGASFRDR